MLRFIICIIFSAIMTLNTYCQNHNTKQIPLWFSEYSYQILSIDKIGVAITFIKSENEKFKITFYSKKGRCYCEKYLDNKIIEKGNYANSLDTLKRYVSSRGPGGRTRVIRVEKYFEPLKNGEWMEDQNGKQKKVIYKLGVIVSG